MARFTTPLADIQRLDLQLKVPLYLIERLDLWLNAQSNNMQRLEYSLFKAPLYPIERLAPLNSIERHDLRLKALLIERICALLKAPHSHRKARFMVENSIDYTQRVDLKGLWNDRQRQDYISLNTTNGRRFTDLCMHPVVR